MCLLLKTSRIVQTKIRHYSKKMVQYRIVMLRHGESKFNELNLFCGWYDAELSAKGLNEAEKAGKTLKKGGFIFDKAFTSVLQRANITLEAILKEIGQSTIPVIKSWRLNEKHYGALTGLNKRATAQKYGEDKVKIWRRSFDIPPPPMEADHKYYSDIVNDKKYAEEPKKAEFPMFESLKLTIERTLPFWNNNIVPEIKAGKRILIVAHGNSLRGIVKHLDNMSNEEIMGINLPTGMPFVYTLDENMKPVKGGSFQFLGEADEVKKAMEAVANQGKAK